jgi:hypothetical protein
MPPRRNSCPEEQLVRGKLKWDAAAGQPGDAQQQPAASDIVAAPLPSHLSVDPSAAQAQAHSKAASLALAPLLLARLGQSQAAAQDASGSGSGSAKVGGLFHPGDWARLGMRS